MHKITHSDFPEIVSMLQFFREESPEYNYVSDDPVFVTQGLWTMFNAGMMIGYIEPTKGFLLGGLSHTWYSDRLDAIEQVLFVYPPFRGSSTAVRLIKATEQQAREAKAFTFSVGVSTGIREAQTVRLYQKLGYALHGQSLRKEL